MNNINSRGRLRTRTKSECFEQGRLFEEYIKNLFNQDSFKTKRWRKSMVIPPDTFIGDLRDPDLELVFLGKNQYPFAVECKWKKRFYHGKIDWARQDQIERYLNFERKRAMPVFIAIGIGGTGDKPEKLFVTPLCNICRNTEVYEHQLIPYKRKVTSRFFYDTVQLKLW